MAEVIPNEELRALLLRIYRMWEAADVDGFAEVLSSAPSLLIVGRDDEEWLTGADGVNVFAAQVREIPRFTVEPGELHTYSCGSVGWIADRPRYLFADGNEERGRLTATFVIDRATGASSSGTSRHLRTMLSSLTRCRRASIGSSIWFATIGPTSVRVRARRHCHHCLQ